MKFYRKIHYLTREFHVKLHAKTDIGFQVQFVVHFKQGRTSGSLAFVCF